MRRVQPNLAFSGWLLCVLLLASFIEDKDLVWLQTQLMVDLQVSPCTVCSPDGNLALDVCMYACVSV